MKKLIMFTLLICMITPLAFSQQIDTIYAKKHPNSTMAALKAYVFLAKRVKMYGTGLVAYRYTDQCNSSIKWGLCEGWQMNFFVQTKNENSDESYVEYLKLFQIHHAVIKDECGVQYLYIYPSPGIYFEKRTFKKDQSDYITGNVYWIKLFIDWSQEDDLINKFKLAINLWGKFNNKEFDDTEKFDW